MPKRRLRKKTVPERKAELMKSALEKTEEPERMVPVSTGVRELDDALKGGYPSPSVILLEGPPGAGKTPFCIAFIAKGLAEGRKSIYICTNNFPREIRYIAKQIGYDLENALFIDGYSWLIGEKGDGIAVSSLDLTAILENFEEILKKEEVERIALDSISTFFLYHDERIVEKFMQAFAALVKARQACAVVALESGTCSERMRSMLEYLTDGTLRVENETLTISRMLAVKPKWRQTRFAITRKGIEIKG